MEIPLKGTIKDVSLVKILVYLNRKRKTGTLTVSASSATKNIYLKMGDVIFASSTYEDDRLGEMLLKAGKITVEQYDKSVELLKATGKRQGAILVELGYLTPKEIFWGLKYQVNEIIQGMFLLEDAGYEFREGDIPAQEVIVLKMSMGNLIYAGINRITNWTRVRNEMPDTDSAMKLSEDPLSLFQDIELSPRDKKILSLIDGRKTIKEVIDGSLMGSFEALRILYVLWSIGMVEEAGRKKAGKAALDEIRFKQGIREFKKGNFQGAIDNFIGAIELTPDTARYLSHLSLAYLKVPGKLKEAEEALHEAIKLEPSNADLHANLGLIFARAGLKKKALGSFQKALRIDPQHEKAQKGLEQVKG